MHATVLAYVTARCAARVANDRYDHVKKTEQHKLAMRIAANGDRSTWDMIDTAKDVLASDMSINSVATFVLACERIVSEFPDNVAVAALLMSNRS